RAGPPRGARGAGGGRADRPTGRARRPFMARKGPVQGARPLTREYRGPGATKIGKVPRPASIVFTAELPKTRSGKIMRRLLRDIAEQRDLGDTTTLADPTVVEEIRIRAVAEASAGE